VQDGVAEFGRYAVIALNKGARDGVEVGHVLATSRVGDVVRPDGDRSAGGFKWSLNPIAGLGGGEAKPAEPAGTPNADGLTPEGRALRQNKQATNFLGRGGEIQLPNERNGLVFVFRVFDKVSYGLVMQSSRQVSVGDAATKP
jgi:hypothetical protein